MCTKPLKGFAIGETKNGKTEYRITPYSTDHVELYFNNTWHNCPDSFISDNAKRYVRAHIEIPCGHCLECRLEYSRQWADRCILEAQQYEDNCFITLTYDDLNIPVVDDVHPETGEITKFKTLVKKDLQDFMKRLRSRLDDKDIKIRFFAAGEYGDESMRPHYHAIIFGWSPIKEINEKTGKQDCHLLKMSNLGYAYYHSDFLKEVWPFGNNLVTECSWETCAYVSRYVVKKYKNEKYFSEKTNIQKEFVTMSRRPGIGLKWLQSHDVCYATFQNNYVSTPNGSRKISHNRYFDSYLEKEFPEIYEKTKEVRKYFQQERKKLEYFESDLPYIDRLHVKEANLKSRTKILRRNLI